MFQFRSERTIIDLYGSLSHAGEAAKGVSDLTDIKNLIAPGRRAFISGIGGVSTSALADLLHLRGVTVRGSDSRKSAVTDRLESLGIHVCIGHSAENLADSEYLIRSAAIHDSNPEIVAAHARGIPVYERADAWGAIMLEHAASLCVCGTHGKTTTTGFAAQVALAAGLDPTVTVGGSVPGLGTHRVGSHDLIIAESCEYCNSFLRFRPTTAVVMNIEEDHLDFFEGGIEEIKRSFERFCRMVPSNGRIAICVDTANSRALFEKLEREFAGAAADADRSLPRGFSPEDAPPAADWSAERPQLVSFSEKSPDAAVRAENITSERGRYSFELVLDPSRLAKPSDLPEARVRVALGVTGEHNVVDALGAAAALWGVVPPEQIASGLSHAKGAARRFEFKGELDGAEIYDDYAHHPSEIAALIRAARAALEGTDGRLLLVFQPHTYSRTKAFFPQFAEVLGRADGAAVLPVYAAREDPDPSVSGELLASACGAHYAPDFADAADWARSLLRPGDMLVTVGAGEAFKAGDILLAKQPQCEK